MSDKLYAFDNESDFRRVVAAVKIVEKVHSTGMQRSGNVRQDAVFAQITELVITTGDDKGKEAKGIEVFFDEASFDYIQKASNPIIYDSDAASEDDASIFSRKNISSKTAMAVDDVVKIAHYPNLSDTSDWLVEETGGSARAYVVITAVTSASVYVGNVLKGPGQTTIVKTGVAIGVFGATENPLSIGYPNFADLVDDVYYLNADLLN